MSRLLTRQEAAAEAGAAGPLTPEREVEARLWLALGDVEDPEIPISVVGMGLRPPLPSFGNMIAEAGGNALGYPWLLYFPASIFAITLLSFLFVADGLQEALDPKGGF